MNLKTNSAKLCAAAIACVLSGPTANADAVNKAHNIPAFDAAKGGSMTTQVDATVALRPGLMAGVRPAGH